MRQRMTIAGVEHKRCPRCAQWLPLTAFGVIHPKDGRPPFPEAYCIPCRRERAKERYHANPEAQRVASIKWRAKNRERDDEQRRRYAREAYRKKLAAEGMAVGDRRRASAARQREEAAVARAERIAREARDGRVCLICGEQKPIDQFGLANRERQVRHSYCKPCRSRYVYLNYRRAHPLTERSETGRETRRRTLTPGLRFRNARGWVREVVDAFDDRIAVRVIMPDGRVVVEQKLMTMDALIAGEARGDWIREEDSGDTGTTTDNH